jgi:hypothetical protein
MKILAAAVSPKSVEKMSLEEIGNCTTSGAA